MRSTLAMAPRPPVTSLARWLPEMYCSLVSAQRLVRRPDIPIATSTSALGAAHHQGEARLPVDIGRAQPMQDVGLQPPAAERDDQALLERMAGLRRIAQKIGPGRKLDGAQRE